MSPAGADLILAAPPIGRYGPEQFAETIAVEAPKSGVAVEFAGVKLK